MNLYILVSDVGGEVGVDGSPTLFCLLFIKI